MKLKELDSVKSTVKVYDSAFNIVRNWNGNEHILKFISFKKGLVAIIK